MAYIGRQISSSTFLKLQGIIEYLQQTGVELPKEETTTPVVTPEAETSDS